jgi:hypothetical protein
MGNGICDPVVRIEDGKFAEHSDVIQDAATKAEPASGLPATAPRDEPPCASVTCALLAPPRRQPTRQTADTPSCALLVILHAPC